MRIWLPGSRMPDRSALMVMFPELTRLRSDRLPESFRFTVLEDTAVTIRPFSLRRDSPSHTMGIL